MNTFYANRLLTLSFMLGFIGLSVYIFEPLRPVHIGFLCLVGLVLFNRDIRGFLLKPHYLVVLGVALAALATQLLWIENWERYIRHAIFICFGLAYFLLGGLVAERRLDIKVWLSACVVVWLVSAAFPFFDKWADAEAFRSYLMTGGVWRNPNNLGTVLVFASLLEFLLRRKISWSLFFAGWFYVVVLNRRADTLAFLLLGSLYLLFVANSTIWRRLQIVLIWSLITLAGLQVAANHDYWAGFLARFSVASQQDHHASSGTLAIPTEKPKLATENQVKEVAQRTQELAAQLDQYSFIPARVHADAMRFVLAVGMLQQAWQMPWWQWVFGQGAGQLNLIWPVDGTLYASPHFFWLEMFFYLGVGWLLLLIAMLYKLDWHGRLTMLIMGIAGMAPSSLLTLSPFWFLFGVLFYMAFIRNGVRA